MNDVSISNATITYAKVFNNQTQYSDALYTFSATSGQKITFDNPMWGGYEIIGS